MNTVREQPLSYLYMGLRAKNPKVQDRKAFRKAIKEEIRRRKGFFNQPKVYDHTKEAE